MIFIMLIKYLTLIPILVFSASMHELFHFSAAKILKLKVPIFSLGLWKPYIKKVFKGTEFRITPWLIAGAYVELEGDQSKEKVGWKARPYRQKLLIAYSGILANLLIVLICYLVHYQSVSIGFSTDIALWKTIITKDTYAMYTIVSSVKSVELLFMSAVNLALVIVNLIPLPALDGGFIWVFALEKILKDKFMKVYNILINYGLYLAIFLQLVACILLFKM